MRILPMKTLRVRQMILPVLMLALLAGTGQKMYAVEKEVQNITLKVEKATLSDIFAELSKQSGYEFFYDEAIIGKTGGINLELDNVSFNEALSRIGKLANLKLNRVNNTIVVSRNSEGKNSTTASENAVRRKISGVVRDANNEPLIGVSVMVRGSTTGTVTDMDGKFVLDNVEDKSVLLFSYIGYVSQSVEVGEQQVINVTLAEDNQLLEEVVVIGYGVQKRRDVTGAISSIKTKDIVAIPTTNALEALQGKVAGVDLISTSGKAGADLSFTVRGERSLNASNAPLILVDGIDYGTTLDINPSDIESIEVLKDASSTAIYGTRGANGIIIITTKKGVEGKSKISLNAFVSSNMITSYPDIMNAKQYADYKREAYRDRTTGEFADDAAVFAPLELEYLTKGYDTDYRDLMMGNGFNQSYELSIAGGNKNTTHIISLGFRDENGLFKNDDYTRFNARIGLDHKVFENVRIGVNFLYTYKDQNNRYSPMNQANKIVPISKPYDEEGKLEMYPSPGYNTQMNPLLDDQKGMRVDNSITERIFSTLYLNWNITNDLFFRTTLGVDSENFRNGFYCDMNSLQGGGVASQSSKTHRIRRKITWENVLTYSKDVDIHSFQGMVGTSTNMNRFEETYAGGKAQTFGGNEFHNLGSNSKEKEIGSRLEESQLASFFGRINYKLSDRYMLTASLRADGSSVFAEGHKWGYFPSVALAWRINEEAFLKNAEAISNLKLRLSWGESGQCAIDPYQTDALLGTSTYSFYNDVSYGLYPKTMSNTKLTWETTGVYNLGIDFGFFKNRISGAVDIYTSETRDVLMRRVIPATNGYTDVMENIGKTGNKGIDVTLSTINIMQKDFTWATDITVSHNKEKIKELASGMTKDEANAWFIGYPFKVFYDYKKVGIWQLGEEAAAAENGQVVGDIKVKI